MTTSSGGPIPQGKPAIYPDWWFQRDVVKRLSASDNSPVWSASYPAADDYAVANIGQLKLIATQAYAELQARLPSSVWTTANGQAVSTLFTGWNNTQGDSYTAINQGQLKAVTQKFYAVLQQIGYATTNPWTTTTDDDDNYATANLGQLKRVFAFDLSLDVDNGGMGNGIADWWESYYGLTGINPQTDSDGDGLTNLQEYQQGSNPLDFFNSQPPLLSIFSGNNQGDFPGLTLAKPLSARLTNQIGTPKSGVAIVFSIQSGGGQLTPNNGGQTDSNGIARASLQLPTPVGATVLIKASYGGQEITFAATVGDINQSPEAPGIPSVAAEHGTTTALLEWEDRSNNETAFYVERALNGRDWTRIATLPANTTTYTDNTIVADEIYFYRIVAHNPAP